MVRANMLPTISITEARRTRHPAISISAVVHSNAAKRVNHRAPDRPSSCGYVDIMSL